MQRLDGYKVRMFSGQERALKTLGVPITDYAMTAREKFLSMISQPNLALLLGIAGLILLYFEFSNPGFVAPGVIGGICLLLSILGFSFLPINYVGVLLIMLAVGLFIAEVKVQEGGVLPRVVGCEKLVRAVGLGDAADVAGDELLGLSGAVPGPAGSRLDMRSHPRAKAAFEAASSQPARIIAAAAMRYVYKYQFQMRRAPRGASCSITPRNPAKAFKYPSG
jgi:hypothetical protein